MAVLETEQTVVVLDELEGFNGTYEVQDPEGEIVIGTSDGDAIYGGDGDDVLYGAGGNNALWGGDGDDTFKYAFTYEQHGVRPKTFLEWLPEGRLPSTQNEFATLYGEWLHYLVYGDSANHDGEGWIGLKTMFNWGDDIKIGLNQNGGEGSIPHITGDGVDQAVLQDIFAGATSIKVVTGKTQQERWYSDIDVNSKYFEGGDSAMTSDNAWDIIWDFRMVDWGFVGDEYVPLVQDDRLLFQVAGWGADEDAARKYFMDEMSVTDDGSATVIEGVGLRIILADWVADDGESVWNYVDFCFA
jgi:hypothetical protein